MAEESYEIREEDVQDFLDDPDNKKTAAALALQLRSQFGRNWFSLSELKKQAINAETIEDFELPVLKAYNLLKEKNGKYRVSLAILKQQKDANAKG